MRRPTLRTLLGTAAGSAAVLVLCSSAVSSAATEGQHREVHLQLPAPTPDVVASSPGLTPVPIPAPDGPYATPLDQLSPEERAFAPYRPMGSTMSAIESAHSETFAYAYFDGVTGVIGFAGGAPDDAIDTLAATGLPYEVHAHVGYRYSDHLAEVNRLSSELADMLDLGAELDLGAGPASFMVGPAPGSAPGRIDVAVASSDATLLQRMEAAAERLRPKAPFEVEVTTSDDPVVLK